MLLNIVFQPDPGLLWGSAAVPALGVLSWSSCGLPIGSLLLKGLAPLKAQGHAVHGCAWRSFCHSASSSSSTCGAAGAGISCGSPCCARCRLRPLKLAPGHHNTAGHRVPSSTPHVAVHSSKLPPPTSITILEVAMFLLP